MTSAAPWPVAFLLAGAVAYGAWRARSLRGDGAVAAVAVGVLALLIGWSWGIYLIGWFVSASLLSRVGRARKAALTVKIVEKGDRRDAWQVLANGGLFALCALGVLMIRDMAEPSGTLQLLPIAAAAALAAAGADTWSTEIGTLWGGTPWSLRERRRVPPGTSGAITLVGTAGGAMGSVVLALFAMAVNMIPPAGVIPVAIGGLSGALADTAIGAWWQERRFCPRCQEPTERLQHDCGSDTIRAGGVARLDNDLVNAVCTVVGVVVAIAIARILS